MAGEGAVVGGFGGGSVERPVVKRPGGFFGEAATEVAGGHLERGGEAGASGLPVPGVDVEAAMGH